MKILKLLILITSLIYSHNLLANELDKNIPLSCENNSLNVTVKLLKNNNTSQVIHKILLMDTLSTTQIFSSTTNRNISYELLLIRHHYDKRLMIQLNLDDFDKNKTLTHIVDGTEFKFPDGCSYLINASIHINHKEEFLINEIYDEKLTLTINPCESLINLN